MNMCPRKGCLEANTAKQMQSKLKTAGYWRFDKTRNTEIRGKLEADNSAEEI
jgi:hypothetical protein